MDDLYIIARTSPRRGENFLTINKERAEAFINQDPSFKVFKLVPANIEVQVVSTQKKVIV